MTKEPCEVCGEETAIGSVFYSDRRVVEHDGKRTFLCTLCQQRVAAAHGGRRLSQEELENLVRGGSLAMISGMPGAH